MEIKVMGELSQEFQVSSIKSSEQPALYFLRRGAKIKKGNWGQIVYQSLAGNTFTNHFIECQLVQELTITVKFPQTTPILFVTCNNQVTVQLNESLSFTIPTKHIDFYYSPDAILKLKFNGRGNYQLVIIQMSDEVIKYYEQYFPSLEHFQECVSKNLHSEFFPNPILMTSRINEIINWMIHCHFGEVLASEYCSILIRELLIILLNDFKQTEGSIDVYEKEVAEKAREIIFSDFEIVYTVQALAKRCKTTKVQLQRAFRKVYGQSVGAFSRTARLNKAFSLLETTDLTLSVVCIMVGYNEASNFAIAFKNYFGLTPGAVQRSKGSSKAC